MKSLQKRKDGLENNNQMKKKEKYLWVNIYALLIIATVTL